MNIRDALNRVVNHLDLSTEEMQDVMRQIMTGQCTDAQIGAFLMGLRMKSESIDEIVGAVQVMRELATPVNVPGANLVDNCGTGGDGMNILNGSSAASFVVAAAGGKVAKHGNRAVSGKSGSADLLEAAGVYLDLKPEEVARCVDTVGVGFMFAPAHHGAMRHAGNARRELGLRTLFNILGPMSNPAGVKRQVLGVFSKELCRHMAEVLRRLGSEHVMVVHSKDGMDEISLAAPTHVAELRNGEIREYDILPEDFGIIGAAMIIVGFSTIFSQLGVGPAIVQRPSLEPRHLRVGFTLSTGLGAVVAGLLWLSAPQIASLFGMQRLEPVLGAVATLGLVERLTAVWGG